MSVSDNANISLRIRALISLLIANLVIQWVGAADAPHIELLIRGPSMHFLTGHHLRAHAPHLQHLSLIEVSELKGFEHGCLSGLPVLQSLYVWRAPLLKKLPHELLRPPPPMLRSLRIINSGLEELPDLSSLADNGNLLHIVILDSNELEEVEDYAFEGSELAELSLKGNGYLKVLHDLSFAGIVGIRELDVSGTAIVFLPAAGLSTIEVLRAQEIISMKTIPSIHDFKHLKEAWLTHHFHCCAFKFPERHDPQRHEEYLTYAERIKQICSRKAEEKSAKKSMLSKREVSHNGHGSDLNRQLQNGTTKNSAISTLEELEFLHSQPTGFGDIQYDTWEVILDSNESGEEDSTKQDSEEYDDLVGIFYQTPVPTPADKDITIICDNFTEESTNSRRWEEVKCWPKSDALNPCEDVLGGVGARALGWTASIAATVGNLAVTAVLLTRPLAPPRLLLLQLALADLGTALYLLLIAAVDTYTADNYFNYAYDWQYGAGCRIAGFLAVWGAQGSLLALAALTLERWLAITRALLPQRRLSPRGARFLLFMSVVYSLFVAAAPLLGASHYSSTSICLPMRRQNWIDTLYLSCLLCGGLFCLMSVIGCYVHIYMTLARDTPRCANITGDARIANKMAVLIATHMACCVPVAAVGFGALIDHPILGVHGAKLLLVLIYPLNSLADPFLYAILTDNFRRDLYLLLDRYGLCSRRAQQYKVPGVVGRDRRCRANNDQPILRRPDGSLTTAYEDLLV